jgi:ketosteroid isomerase-like protein
VSPENVAVIRKVYDAMNRRDLATLEEIADEYPDYQWRNGPDMPEPGLRGRREGQAYIADMFATFDQINTTIEDVIDLGDDGAIFVVHHRVRGAVSGAEVERDEVHLWRTEDGRITGLDEFLSVNDALAAV